MDDKSVRACGPGRADAGGVGLLLCGVGVGAALMYVFDPRSGRRRRALIGDQVTSKINDLSDAAGSKARHIRNRARGVAAEMGSMLGRGKKGAEHGGGDHPAEPNHAGSLAA